ncbi:MAG: HAD family phosphatase [Bacteroidaceae bacterium]|nr:HAD family phosphatase [Bacteroidaceae bacterium]
MIKHIVFDFGGVLIDWNPLYLYNNYFGNEEQARWFIENICTMEWNVQMDAGKPFAQGIAELTAKHPEWAYAIAAYRSRWGEMIGGPIPGMLRQVRRLKQAGYHVWGLSNWNWDTFSTIKDDFPAVAELEGIVVSGLEHVIKPQPAIYNILLERFKLRPEECVFVDDNPANVEGARAVGMYGLQFADAEQMEQELKTHFHVCFDKREEVGQGNSF